MATKNVHEKNALSGWSAIIRELGDEARERELERKKEAQRFCEALKDLEPLERTRELTKAIDMGLLTLNEYFAEMRLVLGLPTPE